MVTTITKQIDIDIEVGKAIEAARNSYDEGPNEILRRLLGIDSTPVDAPTISTGKGWNNGRVFLPNGSNLHMFYNGSNYTAKIKNGNLWADGRTFRSLSGAARHFSDESLNGWKYWYVFLPGENEAVLVDTLRKKRPTRKRLT